MRLNLVAWAIGLVKRLTGSGLSRESPAAGARLGSSAGPELAARLPSELGFILPFRIRMKTPVTRDDTCRSSRKP
ncbi:MAG: hypothetical protein R6U28_05260 [Cyclonatronaceae bacterium]